MNSKKLLLVLIASFAIKCTSKVHTMEHYQKTNDRLASDLTQETAHEEIEQLISDARKTNLEVLKECIYEQKNSHNDMIKIDIFYFTYPFKLSDGKIMKFDARLYKNDKKIGIAEFSFGPTSKEGKLSNLHIVSANDRAKRYGSLLFACSIKKLIDLGCIKVSIKADPSDLTENQSWPKMLPKLINFYKQLGAEPDHELYIPYGLPVPEPCRYLCLKDITKAREGIYKILEQWELKKSNKDQPSPEALNRAAIIANHVTQSSSYSCASNRQNAENC